MIKQTMPCPWCKKEHPKGPYGSRVRHGVHISYPADVRCACGAALRVNFPMFYRAPFGWDWRTVPEDEADFSKGDGDGTK
jgi:hypothetical protein